MKGALSSLTTITSYNELSVRLTAYEVELRRDRDIEPGQALFSKYTKGGRSQKSSKSYRKGVPPSAKSKLVKGKFTDSSHHCGKPGHKIHECRVKFHEEGGLGTSAKRSVYQTERAGVIEEQL